MEVTTALISHGLQSFAFYQAGGLLIGASDALETTDHRILARLASGVTSQMPDTSFSLAIKEEIARDRGKVRDRCNWIIGSVSNCLKRPLTILDAGPSELEEVKAILGLSLDIASGRDPSISECLEGLDIASLSVKLGLTDEQIAILIFMPVYEMSPFRQVYRLLKGQVRDDEAFSNVFVSEVSKMNFTYMRLIYGSCVSMFQYCFLIDKMIPNKESASLDRIIKIVMKINDGKDIYILMTRLSETKSGVQDAVFRQYYIQNPNGGNTKCHHLSLRIREHGYIRFDKEDQEGRTMISAELAEVNELAIYQIV